MLSHHFDEFLAQRPRVGAFVQSLGRETEAGPVIARRNINDAFGEPSLFRVTVQAVVSGRCGDEEFPVARVQLDRAINLPLAGAPGIECRTGGTSNDYQLVFTFTGPVTFNSAAVTGGTGTVSSTSGNATTTLTVNLTGVGTAQTIAVKLLGVSDGTATADVEVEMGVLLVDMTGNGSVTASDIGQTKGQSGQAVTGSNFRTDVNASGGTINASDIGLVKSNSCTQLPP